MAELWELAVVLEVSGVTVIVGDNGFHADRLARMFEGRRVFE